MPGSRPQGMDGRVKQRMAVTPSVDRVPRDHLSTRGYRVTRHNSVSRWRVVAVWARPSVLFRCRDRVWSRLAGSDSFASLLCVCGVVVRDHRVVLRERIGVGAAVGIRSDASVGGGRGIGRGRTSGCVSRLAGSLASGRPGIRAATTLLDGPATSDGAGDHLCTRRVSESGSGESVKCQPRQSSVAAQRRERGHGGAASAGA